jgi:putative membrane protein
MSVDARIARGGVLVLWAIFFAVLWETGTSDRYLGSRTQWIVPFGAVVLALAALLYAYGYAKTRRQASALTLREASGLFALLIPLAAVLLVPHAALGSFAASRKGTGLHFLSARQPAPSKPSDASFLDIRMAEGDTTFAAHAGIKPGLRVHLLGFVSGSTDVPRGTFEIARFYIACCIADAQPVGVPIDAGRGYPKDTWLEITGSLERRGRRFVVEAQRAVPAKEPSQPYLSFRT